MFHQTYLSSFSTCLFLYFPYFLLSISSINHACWYSPGITFTFCLNRLCSFFIKTMSISVSFSPTLNVTFVFPYLLSHVFHTHKSFSRQNSNNSLPSKFLWPMPCPPCTKLNPSICLPMCPLKLPMHICDLQNAYPTHFSACHTKTVFLPNFFHFVEHTYISTSARPL